jgi:hypothetical protein
MAEAQENACTLTPAQSEDIEDRRFRRWLIKMCVYAVLFSIVVLVTAVAVVGVKTGQFPDNGWISKLIDFAQGLLPIVQLMVGSA